MATITIRNLDEKVKHGLRLRSVEHGCSMEAEARMILSDAVERPVRPLREGIGRVRGKWSGRLKTDEVMDMTRAD